MGVVSDYRVLLAVLVVVSDKWVWLVKVGVVMGAVMAFDAVYCVITLFVI